jgi:hypothetical protein
VELTSTPAAPTVRAVPPSDSLAAPPSPAPRGPAADAPAAPAARTVPGTPQPGGATGNAATAGSPGGKVNLDGSSSGGGGPAEPAPGASAPALNLDLHGAGVGPSTNRSRSGLFPVLPSPPEPASKLSKDIEKAARPECKGAYTESGLLAVIPLAKDALTGKGCKW